MNSLTLAVTTLGNQYYEYFGRSPRLFLDRVDALVKRKLGWDLGFAVEKHTDAIAWISESESMHSRVYIFNYWTEHYGVNEVTLEAELRDAEGKCVGKQSYVLNPRQTLVWEAASLLHSLGLPTPWRGSVIFRRSIDGAGYGTPLKLLQEYYNSESLAAIHEYSTVDSFAYDEHQTGITLSTASDVLDVRIGLVGCHSEAARLPLTLTLLTAEGERTNFDAGTLKGGEAVELSLSALAPAWRELIGSKLGNLIIHASQPIGRPLVFHLYRQGVSFCLNHATGDKSRPARVYRDPIARSLPRGPVWSGAVIFGRGVSSAVTAINNWGFDLPFVIECSVFDPDGKLLGTLERSLQPWETVRLDLSKFFPDSASAREFVFGSARVHLRPHENQNLLPVTFDANMEYEGEHWRQPVNNGSSLLNCVAPAGARTSPVSRTKVFMRVRHDGRHETYALLTNHSSDPAYVSRSKTVLRLISEDGSREVSRTVELSPGGSAVLSVGSLFAEADELLKPHGVGTLHIRDPQVKLGTIHLVRDLKTGAFAGDHCFGG